MYFAQKIEAPNDENGNPQRGWLVYDIKSKNANVAGFIDEGYGGRAELRSRLGKSSYMEAPLSISVSQATYRRAKRQYGP